MLRPQQICVVYGHGGEAVPEAMQQYPVKFTTQNTFASHEGNGFELRLKLVMIDPPVD